MENERLIETTDRSRTSDEVYRGTASEYTFLPQPVNPTWEPWRAAPAGLPPRSNPGGTKTPPNRVGSEALMSSEQTGHTIGGQGTYFAISLSSFNARTLTLL